MLLPEPLSSPGWLALSLCLGSLEAQDLLWGKGDGRRGHGRLRCWRDRVAGPTAAAPHLSVVMGAGSGQVATVCAPPSLLLLGSLKLWAPLPQLEGQDCRHGL